jgi:hypothetical protein
MRQVFLSLTKEGKIVVKMKGYDRYFFCPDTFKVFSRKSATEFSPLTPRMEGKAVYYRLYRGGVQDRVFLWQILRDNMSGIETFLYDREGGSKHLSLVSPRL